MFNNPISDAKVFIAPEELIGHPDLTAMLQAFYSRSHLSIQDRLKEFDAEGAGSVKIRESLEKFYIGYGHDSIGDCGDIVLFIEGVSFLTAKAVQDTPLYSGQETSSRYIDYSEKPRPTCLGKDSWHDFWIEKYKEALPLLGTYVDERFSDLSIAARKPKIFDIARGLLPLTGLTQLSWKGSIRDIRRHLSRLLAHPYSIIQADATAILDKLVERYPSLFNDVVPVPGYKWFLNGSESIHFREAMSIKNDLLIDLYNESEYGDMDTDNLFRACGNLVYVEGLDYGGYRDAQRHRRCFVKSTDPMRIKSYEIDEVFETGFYSILSEAGFKLNIPDVDDSDFIPCMMGEVDTLVSADLEQWKYLWELRSKNTVHPSVREFYKSSYRELTRNHPYIKNLNVRIDDRPSDYERRGTQDIVRQG